MQPAPAPSSAWKWWVCGLLLLATMINYMDRLVLNQTIKRLMTDLAFDKAGYGQLEGYFGIAFATGALTLGFVVDRLGPRVVYPLVVLLWSVAGFLTGFVRTFEELLACRIALGFFEAANWSCALKTTQAILRPDERTLGNGILQSGAAIGAVFTPMLVLLFLRWDLYGGWRPAFWVVGALGLVWVAIWLFVVRPHHLAGTASISRPAGERESTAAVVGAILGDRRFWLLAFTVIAINLTWHFFRAWLPLFLQEKHHYSEEDVQWFAMAYYLATDLGTLAAGFLALRLARGGVSVHNSRLVVFGGCAAVVLLSIPVAFLPAGQGHGLLLFGLLLVLGFAALGLFPNYYSFSQELTSRHQGKVSGMLGCACWIGMSVMQLGVGYYIQATQAKLEAQALPGMTEEAAQAAQALPAGLTEEEVQALVADMAEEEARRFAAGEAYTWGVALAGLPPLLALGALVLFWKGAPVPVPAPEPAPVPDGVPTQALGAYTTRPDARTTGAQQPAS